MVCYDIIAWYWPKIDTSVSVCVFPFIPGCNIMLFSHQYCTRICCSKIKVLFRVSIKGFDGWWCYKSCLSTRSVTNWWRQDLNVRSVGGNQSIKQAFGCWLENKKKKPHKWRAADKKRGKTVRIHSRRTDSAHVNAMRLGPIITQEGIQRQAQTFKELG